MIKMTNTVLAFAKETNTVELHEQFADLVNHYRVENKMIPTGKTLNYDATISFEDKSKAVHDQMLKEINRLAGMPSQSVVSEFVYMNSPQHKYMTYAVINSLIDMIIPDTILDSVGMYTEVKTGGFGDNFSFDIEPNDLFYVTKFGRGKRHAEGQKSFNGQVIVTPTEHTVSVQVNLYRVLSGKENLAAFAMKALRSIETEMAYDAFTAFNTAVASLPTTATKDLQRTGWSQTNGVELNEKVTTYNNGAKSVYVGTRAAVQKILPSDTNYRLQIDSDYVKIGYVREFFGNDVIVLPNKANWKDPYQTLLDDDKIYIMSPSSQKIVKLCIEGSTISIVDDTYANANLTQQSTMKKMWGTGIATNATFAVINL